MPSALSVLDWYGLDASLCCNRMAEAFEAASEAASEVAAESAQQISLIHVPSRAQLL